MKRTLLIILILLTPAFLFAQESDVLRLGLKVGPNFFFGSGTPSHPEVTGTRLTVGFIGGGFIEFVPIDNLSVELDVLLTWFNYGVNTSLPSETLTLQYTAMEFPLIIKGRLPLGPGTAFLGIGPDFIILMGKVNIKIGTSTITQNADQIFHTALIFSGGYDWAINGDSNLTLELRYLRSFSSPADSADINANRFDLLIGWSVNF